MPRARKKSPLLPPYFVWRDGRPRWVPGPAVRALGFSGRDLKDERGEWLALGPAIEAAKVLNDEVAALRAAGGRAAGRRRPPRTRKTSRTVRALFEAWTVTPEFRRLRQSTKADYREKAKVFLDRLGPEPVAAIRRKHVKAWWREMHDERGHAMANAVVAVFRAMLSFGCDEEWIETNPAFSLKLPTVPPRVVFWTPEEAEALVAAADDAGEHGIADAVFLALHTAQRQADVLALKEEKIVAGRVIFRQAKTGARISIPLTPQLSTRLDAIRARRRGGEIVDLAGERDALLVVDRNGNTFNKSTFGRTFRPIRATVAEEHPGIAGKTFQDLRDTAITRLALAGCTVPEIRAISGHELDTIHRVLAHYLALDDRMADAAIDKLKAYAHEEGIKV